MEKVGSLLLASCVELVSGSGWPVVGVEMVHLGIHTCNGTFCSFFLSRRGIERNHLAVHGCWEGMTMGPSRRTPHPSPPARRCSIPPPIRSIGPDAKKLSLRWKAHPKTRPFQPTATIGANNLQTEATGGGIWAPFSLGRACEGGLSP